MADGVLFGYSDQDVEMVHHVGANDTIFFHPVTFVDGEGHLHAVDIEAYLARALYDGDTSIDVREHEAVCSFDGGMRRNGR